MITKEQFKFQLIDLGLPSGTLWMDRNIGASSPSDYGLYFAWGETDGYTADEVGFDYSTQKYFEWKDYKFAIDDYFQLTKYCNREEWGFEGFVDKKSNLELDDDAAYQYTNGECSIPTKEELQELFDNTTSEWTTMDDVNGSLFTSKTNGNFIFIPAAGFGDTGSLLSIGDCSGIWSSSLDEGNASGAYFLLFSSYVATIKDYSRCNGFSVRGVKVKQ